MTTRVTPIIALVVLSSALLASCGLIPTGPAIIDADHIADTAADALRDEFDARYRVECGDEDVELTKDTQIVCTALNRTTQLEYDATVTITDVTGTRYEIEVQLANVANNPDDGVDEDADDDDSTQDTGLSVSNESFVEVVADGLTGILGYEPADLECLSQTIEIIEGNVEYCFFTDEDGDARTVEATIDGYNESTGQYRVLSEIVI